jgi:hypothetical protein
MFDLTSLLASVGYGSLNNDALFREVLAKRTLGKFQSTINSNSNDKNTERSEEKTLSPTVEFVGLTFQPK